MPDYAANPNPNPNPNPNQVTGADIPMPYYAANPNPNPTPNPNPNQVTGADIPMPYAANLEKDAIPVAHNVLAWHSLPYP